jgi:hypothetical protein
MYSAKSGSEIIFEGHISFQGFSLSPGNTLALLIDQNSKAIEWHVEGEHLLTSNFTNAMMTAP